MVLGASMAGLLAARVLTEFYDRVTIVDRDELDDTAAPRHGVPQSRQPHVVLARCGQVVEELFPGVTDEMVGAGAHLWRSGDLGELYTRFSGHLVTRTGRLRDPEKLTLLHASRPFIESHVRRRVRALPAVTLVDRHDADALTWSADTVTGVRVTSRPEHRQYEIAADLVVDATGRGSRTPALLERMGFARPREDHLTVHVSYVSMPVRIPDGLLNEILFIDMPMAGRPYGWAMSRCENNDWQVLVGTLGIAPPAGEDEFYSYLRELMPAHAYAALLAGEPLADIALYKFPASRWRRYDKLTRMPCGLLVTGDAVASFNPIYGQGMTVAAVAAIALRECLRADGGELSRRFHRAAAKSIDIAWRTAVGSDLALPEVEGKRSLSMKMTTALLDRILLACETDPWMAQEFQMVTGMLAPPSRLVHPKVLRRVLAARGRQNLDADGVPATA
ncbi:hydroxylase [Mycolicibacterium parafortuitum]